MSLRAAQVPIYVDADILGLGRILAGLRNDVTYPGDPGAVIHKRKRPRCPIESPDVLDTDWIPQVAARGWLIVTRDSMIAQNRNEIAAVLENKAKMVALNHRVLSGTFVPLLHQPRIWQRTGCCLGPDRAGRSRRPVKMRS
jgi:PIN domain-containing protein